MLKFWLICIEKSSCIITPRTALKLPPHQPLLGFSTTFFRIAIKPRNSIQLSGIQYFINRVDKIIGTTQFFGC